MLSLKPFVLTPGRRVVHLFGSHVSISLRPGVFRPWTRMRVRLLGPCFKTGRTSWSRQRCEAAEDRYPLSREPRRIARRVAAAPRLRRSRWTQRAHAVLRRAPLTGPGDRSGYDAGDLAIRSFGSLTSISSAISLSFQSTFHLSLAVLFCYWTLAGI